MFFSGISDEAGATIDTQIKAHQELGWNHIELRKVDGQNFSAMPDGPFNAVCRSLEAANMEVSCFASALANWARPITGDFQPDLDELKCAIPHMRRLGTPFIRIMSYPNDADHPLPEPEWRKETIRRIRILAKMAEDGGIVLAHENCSGWAGVSPENSLILLSEVDSPGLKLIYDTGNPVSYGQDPWTYYQGVRDHVVYVHIKDGKTVDGKCVHTYCGEGEGRIPEVLADLFSRGYDGGFSIEPHVAAIIHTGQEADSATALFDSYVKYGRMLMAIAERVKPK